MTPASLFIARRIIFPRSVTATGKSFSMAVLCVALSLVPLISVLSMSNALIKGMTERIIGLSSSHIKVLFRANAVSGASALALNDAANKIALVPGVAAAYPESDAAALALSDSRREGVMIRAVNADMFTKNNAFSTMLKVTEGSLDGFAPSRAAGGSTDEAGGGAKGGSAGDPTGVSAGGAAGEAAAIPAVVGQKTAKSLGLEVGDTFRLVTAARKAGKVVPRAFTARMEAAITSGYEELDATWVFIPLDDAYRKMGQSLLSFVLVETDDAFSDALYQTQRAVADAVKGNATVYRWDELNQSEAENFASTQAMLICIMSLIVLVASLNISSSLMMLAEERQREIAILKCTGAASGTISAAYILAGGAAGLLGSMLGVPLGLLCAVNMNAIVKGIEIAVNAVVSPASPIRLMDSAYYLSSIPIDVPLKSIIIIVAMTLALSLLVSVLPACRAARQ